MAVNEAALEVRDLVVRYGAATALDRVSLHVGRGEMVALVGPNGAGKTTLINAVSGLLKPAAGDYRVTGNLAQVPEGRQLFADMTVEDNLRLGAWTVHDRDLALGRLKRQTGAGVHWDDERIVWVFPRLAQRWYTPADYLSGGEQQMVAVGRALMARPDLLAVDELSFGLAPMVVDDLAEHLVGLNRSSGMAVLLVEQNARLALDLCPRVYVLEAGRVALEGASEDLRSSEAVQMAYLGGSVDTPSPKSRI